MLPSARRTEVVKQFMVVPAESPRDDLNRNFGPGTNPESLSEAASPNITSLRKSELANVIQNAFSRSGIPATIVVQGNYLDAVVQKLLGKNLSQPGWETFYRALEHSTFLNTQFIHCCVEGVSALADAQPSESQWRDIDRMLEFWSGREYLNSPQVTKDALSALSRFLKTEPVPALWQAFSERLALFSARYSEFAAWYENIIRDASDLSKCRFSNPELIELGRVTAAKSRSYEALAHESELLVSYIKYLSVNEATPLSLKPWQTSNGKISDREHLAIEELNDAVYALLKTPSNPALAEHLGLLVASASSIADSSELASYKHGGLIALSSVAKILCKSEPGPDLIDCAAKATLALFRKHPELGDEISFFFQYPEPGYLTSGATERIAEVYLDSLSRIKELVHSDDEYELLFDQVRNIFKQARESTMFEVRHELAFVTRLTELLSSDPEINKALLETALKIPVINYRSPEILEFMETFRTLADGVLVRFPSPYKSSIALAGLTKAAVIVSGTWCEHNQRGFEQGEYDRPNFVLERAATAVDGDEEVNKLVLHLLRYSADGLDTELAQEISSAISKLRSIVPDGENTEAWFRVLKGQFGELPHELLKSFFVKERTFLSSDPKPRFDEFCEFTKTLTHQLLLEEIFRGTFPQISGAVRHKLQNIYQNDAPPFALEVRVKDSSVPNPDALKAFSEVSEVYLRAFDLYRGFAALTYDTRRAPGEELPPLAKFGLDIGAKVSCLNSSSNLRFPGAGLVLSDFKLESIFAKDPSRPGDPFDPYKRAWPWLANDFELFSDVRITFSRGFIALSGKDPEEFSINGQPYSYVVFNDHFHNRTLDLAYLIPTQIISGNLKNATLPATEFQGFSRSKRDFISERHTLAGLALKAEELGQNILNLGWPSNLGGLCNAFPPCSDPYHRWEGALRFSHTKDLAGHVHKSHITGSYQSAMSPEMDMALIPLRMAHDLVYTLTNRYQNLFDIFRFSLSLWHKGQTLSAGQGDQQESAEEALQLQPPEEDEGNPISNPASIRMLREAYRWHHGLKSLGKTEPDEYPLLVLAPVLDYWSKPQSPFILDTESMVLSVQGREIKLPKDSDGQGIMEYLPWLEQVMPYFTSEFDLRFYHRRDIL